jgi:predicted DNA-binding transcriptional regulator YafY
MPPRLRSEVRAIQDATETLPGAAVEVDGEVLQVLARACRDTVRVRFSYADRAGTASERLVEPVRLVATGRRWYLLAWDVDRDDWRVFRLDRMSSVTATTWRFRDREHPDPAGHVQRAVSSGGYRLQARVRVLAPAERVREKVSPASGKIVPVDDHSCILEAGAEDTDAFAVHLAWFGFDFEVLEPAELTEAVQRLGRRMSEAATRSGGADGSAQVGGDRPAGGAAGAAGSGRRGS